jgi:hypothetical protein
MQVNLFVLAHEKIGISRNYVYASSLRQQLEPALEELRDKGLLSEFEFVGKGKSTEVILVAAHAPRKVAIEPPHSTNPHTSSHDLSGVRATTQPSNANTQAGSTEEALELLLTQRGIADKQARRLVEGRGIEALERIEAIVAHFDKLVSSGSHLVSRNPQGFLYRAVEKPFEFVLPNDKVAVGARAQNELNLGARNTDAPQRPLKGKGAQVDAEVSYLLERKAALDRIKTEVSEVEVSGLRVEVETALAKLKAHISPQRFMEAVEHGVEQRLLEHRGFPDFDKWCKSNAQLAGW